MSRKSLDPEAWSKWNRVTLRGAKETKEATVWFWRYIPDPVILALGVLFLLPGLPLFVSLIGGSEVVFLVLVRIVNVFPFLSRIVPFVTERCARFGSRLMKDPRDGAFFLPIVALTVWGPLLFSWAVYRYRLYGFEISTVFLYHFLRLMPRYRMFAYMYVLVHKEGHSRTGFWKWDVLNFGILNYFAGIFYGDCCNSFPMAHNKIHHAYDNDLDDVHTNLDLDRSRPISFLYYVPRFALYWAGLTPLVKFAQKSQWTFFWKMLYGMAIYYSVWVVCWRVFGGLFTVYYVIYPFIEAVTFFGGISYLWHAWCDPRDPNNPYVDSVTIVNGLDNIFNEDYHVVHHTKPLVHWSDYPQHYQDLIGEYKKFNACVFENCEEGMMLYWLLAEKWDDMAAHMVDLSGKLSHDEKKALCLERLRSRLQQRE